MTARIDKVLERRTYAPNSLIMQQGDLGNAAFLVQTGKVLIYTTQNGKETQLAKLGPGQIFGEMALIREDVRSANVKALENTTLIVIDHTTFSKKLEKTDPTIRAILEMLMERLAQNNKESVKRRGSLQNLCEDVNALYENVYENLPKMQQRTFKNAVFPKLDDFLQALTSFQDRFKEE